MVIKQKIILSNDIQENPGPFFESCFKIATEFYNEPNNENYFYLRTCVDQLIANQSQENPIPFPDGFLNDEVVDIWRKCELEIRGNPDFGDEFKKSLQTIWQFWFMASFKKELNCAVEKQPKTIAPRRNENVTELEHMSVQKCKIVDITSMDDQLKGKSFSVLRLNVKTQNQSQLQEYLEKHF